MKCRKLMELLEGLSPVSYASSWDNVGLLLGKKEKEINKILLAVDVTDDVVCQAIENKVDMIISHHPLIFKPLSKVISDDYRSKRVFELLQADINYYACHTNFDVMNMADVASDRIGITKKQVLEPTFEDDISKEGFGRYGYLPHIMTLRECGEYIKQVFQIEHVKVFGNMDTSIATVAVCPGSGKSMIQAALDANVDVFVTGDIDHHEGLDAKEQGLFIIDAGHFAVEKIFVPYMEEFLSHQAKEIQVVCAKENNPFEII